MEGIKRPMTLILISFLKYVYCGGPPPCQYEILGLDDNITVNSSLDTGEIVYTLTIQEAARLSFDRRKRGESSGYIAQEHDIILDRESTNFAIGVSQANGYHEVTVSRCLVAGQTETLEFVFNETLDDGACDVARLTIEVDPTDNNGSQFRCPHFRFFTVDPYMAPQDTANTIWTQYGITETPEFDMGSTDDITVDVNTCTTGVILDVLSLEFDNNADCLSINCLVNNLNDVKVFWVDAGTEIKTYTGDIDFNKIYEMLLTCFDSGAPSLSSSQTILKVSFNQTVLCPSATTTTTPSGVVLDTTTRGFFDTPANVAVVAALSAIVVGIGAGVGVYILITRFSGTKINPGAGRKTGTVVE